MDAVLVSVQPDAAARRARSRAGSPSDGLPIGMQLVGPMFDDALVLRAARAYEQARPIPRPAIG